MRRTLSALVMCVPVLAYGQVPKPVLDELASDLAMLHKQVQDAQTQSQRAGSPNFVDVDRVRVTKPNAQILAGAAANAKIVTSANRGDTLSVLDKVNDWYAVEVPIKGADKIGVQWGWIRAADSVPVADSAAPSTGATDLYESLLRGATAVRDKYKNNQYINVTGFSVNIGFAPSLTVEFGFK